MAKTATNTKGTIDKDSIDLEKLNLAIASIKESKPTTELGGIGNAWREICTAIGNCFALLSIVAKTGKSLGNNAYTQAEIARIESSQDFLNSLGIEAKGPQAVVLAGRLLQAMEG